MKATCPSCQTSYRVADDKVPAQGAQIKCPKCQGTFVVRRSEETASQPPVAETQGDRPAPLPPPPAAAQAQRSQPPAAQAPAGQPAPPAPAQAEAASPHDQATPLIDLINEASTEAQASQPPVAAQKPPADPAASAAGSQTPNLDSLDGEAFISAGNVDAKRQSRAGAVSTIRAQSSSGRDSLEGFRVRTARGLTYDFPSERAMLRWLDEREDTSGCQVAPPGKEFVSVEEFMASRQKVAPLKLGGEQETLQAGQPDAASPGAAPRRRIDRLEGDQSDPSKPIEVGRIQPLVPVPPGVPVPADHAGTRAEVFDLPAGPRAGIGMWTSLVVSLLVLAAGAAVTLTRYGVVDLSGVPPVSFTGIQFPEVSHAADGPVGVAPSLPKGGDPELVFQDALGAGKRALRAKQFSKAALEFNRALGVHPGAVDALEGMAQAYAGLGDKASAREARAKARKIRGR